MKETDTDVPPHLEQARHELSEEHRELRSLAERLRGTPATEELAPLLEDLHRRLTVHFLHEEFAGGWFEAMARLSPAHQSRVKALSQEHARILATVRGLAARARGHDRDDEVADETHALAERLVAHERQELALAATARTTAHL